MLCNPAGKDKHERMDLMSGIYDHWISKRNIVDRFSRGRNGYDAFASADNMKWFIEQRLEVPFDHDLPLSKDQIRRIYVEIDSLANALSGKFNNFAWIVPEGISKLDPTARSFYKQLNNILLV